MTFENLHTFPLLLSIILIWFIVYFFIIYTKNNKKILSLIFLVISVIFLIISLFSPRFWKYDKNIDVQGWNILFVMDVSKSMNVFDISHNNNFISRLQAQKLAITKYCAAVQNTLRGFLGFLRFLFPLTDTFLC